jgi:hypothetical protein
VIFDYKCSTMEDIFFFFESCMLINLKYSWFYFCFLLLFCLEVRTCRKKRHGLEMFVHGLGIIIHLCDVVICVLFRCSCYVGDFRYSLLDIFVNCRLILIYFNN